MIITVTFNPSLDEWVYLPQLRLGELNRATQFARYPGGKGINVSRVVHELGGKTLAVALAGDSDGTILSHLLTHHRLPHRFIEVAGSTRNNYHIHTNVPNALTQINCPGPRVSAQSLGDVERLLSQSRRRTSCVVLSGSLPPGLPTRTYQRLIARLNRLGVPTVLDTSGPALRQGLTAHPWLTKPNRAEAEALLGKRLRRLSDVANAAKQLVAPPPVSSPKATLGKADDGPSGQATGGGGVGRGPQLAIVSLGPDGAVLAAQAHDEVLWGKPPRVPVESAVGAGDSLIAGFVVGWLRTHSLHEALRLGIACGAACAMTPGTELCHRADVERLKRLVRIRAI